MLWKPHTKTRRIDRRKRKLASPLWEEVPGAHTGQRGLLRGGIDTERAQGKNDYYCTKHALPAAAGGPSQSRLTPCQLSQRESQVALSFVSAVKADGRPYGRRNETERIGK